MAISYMNTTEVENIAKELLSLADELDTNFDDLFARFAGVPDQTREWVGGQANFYFEKVATEKQQYTDFVEQLRSIGQKLNNDATEMRVCMNKNNHEESRK